MLTRTAIAKALGQRLADTGPRLTPKETIRLLDETVEIIKDGLIAGEKVSLDGLGRLRLDRPTPARRAINRVLAAAFPRPVLRFTPSAAFLEAFVVAETAAAPEARS